VSGTPAATRETGGSPGSDAGAAEGAAEGADAEDEIVAGTAEPDTEGTPRPEAAAWAEQTRGAATEQKQAAEQGLGSLQNR
jgi:hypothetical protein